MLHCAWSVNKHGVCGFGLNGWASIKICTYLTPDQVCFFTSSVGFYTGINQGRLFGVVKLASGMIQIWTVLSSSDVASLVYGLPSHVGQISQSPFFTSYPSDKLPSIFLLPLPRAAIYHLHLSSIKANHSHSGTEFHLLLVKRAYLTCKSPIHFAFNYKPIMHFQSGWWVYRRPVLWMGF